MKKILLSLLIFFGSYISIFSFEYNLIHTYSADYGLFPDTPYSQYYISKLADKYPVKYCVQSNIRFSKAEAQGYTCSEVLKKLDQMGGLDKECYGVSYIDAESGVRKPIFKKASFDSEKGLLYVKDKAAGGLNFDVKIDTYKNLENIYVVNAVINKRPDNIFVRGIKKREAEIFVLMQENDEYISVYALIQCSYSPLEHKFLKNIVEMAVTSRVLEIENWFYRMMCGIRE